MPISDIYLPLSVTFPRDPKVRALMYEHGQDGMLAAYLYIMMCLYCRENLTDGWVPAAEIPALAYPLSKPDAERLASDLVTARLVANNAASNGSSMRVLAYVKRNGTRKDAEQRSEQARSASRNRWRRHDVQRPASDPQTGVSTKTETETIPVPLSPVPDTSARARDDEQPGREIDLPNIVIYEVRTLTGGLVLGRERAAEIVAELIGTRRLTSPAAYLRRALRAHPDLFELADPGDPDKPRRRRKNTAADTPAAEVTASAVTVDGRDPKPPATEEQRKRHADAARAALGKTRPADTVPLPDDIPF